jgi:putative membrane-bound dehydrogenase-like protein
MKHCIAACALAIGLTATVSAENQTGKKKVLFLAGKRSHGYGAHEFNAGSLLMQKWFKQVMPEKVESKVFLNGEWPAAKEFEGVDAVVIFCNGGGGHLVNRHLKEFDEVMKKGVGLACLHYAVEVPKGDPGDHMIKWMGGYFEAHWSVNPHWVAKFTKFGDHPICNGVKPFEANDEWYFHMRFQEGLKGVTPILSAIAPDATMKRGNGAHSGNPAVRKAVAAKEPQHLAWAYERGPEYNNGRGFGFTGLHSHWNWKDPSFRKTVLNAVAWIARIDIPKNGIEVKTPTQEELEANQDYPRRGKPKKAAKLNTKKAKFKTQVVTSKVPGHSVDVDVDIKGSKELWLVVGDGGNGYGCDWADWAEPRLVGPDGEKKLTELKWKTATAAWGKVRINKNAGGGSLKINGKPVSYGIGAHAVSVIGYVLPKDHKFERFKARAGLDNGGTNQSGGGATSVQFFVFTEKPPQSVTSVSRSRGGGGGVEASEALATLDVAEGLEAQLFASEPMVVSLTNLDIDHKGRIWTCEVVNYRRNKGKRPEGDRILILEDTNGDNKADKSTVYYQGNDVDSAMGICVLGNKTIVTCSPNVIVFTDEDGDDRPDRKEYLFTKTGGAQHDHSAHSFLFGPDGKLYWNFGNTGRQVHDKDGEIVVDMAGNEVRDRRQPYMGGMAFRCNLDGSEFETLGHNFRNNYEATVDSFGTVWQSDNDDDGNRGVRINYVMEFGNFGYRSQINGSGWRSKRANIEKEIPLRHWHLNDPGVVPNFVQTGAGSPTGITVYEGDLLPEIFRNQVIHCDAGPNVVRAYPATRVGAGYKGEMVNILQGARDRWFRPADVAVAPDGSLFVTDWYDPGVGGHGQRDLGRGRIFRVAPKGHKYSTPEFDFTTAEGAAEALKNPCYSVRQMAWTALNKMGAQAESALTRVLDASNPRHRARALWLLGKIAGKGQTYVEKAIADPNEDIRIVGLRLARQLKDVDTISVVEKLAKDKSPSVRRECSIALRHSKSPKTPALWAELATQHDGKDRWYLEALGIGSDLRADECFAAWLKKAGDNWNTPAGHDIVWRSRSKAAMSYMAQILINPKTPKEQHARYMRSFDFHPKGKEKNDALEAILLEQ